MMKQTMQINITWFKIPTGGLIGFYNDRGVELGSNRETTPAKWLEREMKLPASD